MGHGEANSNLELRIANEGIRYLVEMVEVVHGSRFTAYYAGMA